MAYLICQSSENQGKIYPLNTKEFFIGRDTNCNIRILDTRVSRNHCKLTKSPRGIELFDLNSKNGTFVNGTRVQSKILRDGDIISIGHINFLFVTKLKKKSDEPEKKFATVLIPKEWSAADSQVQVQLPAEKIHVPLDSVYLHQKKRTDQDRLRLIYDIGQMLVSLLDPQILLDKIMESIFTVIPADRGFIMLLDEESKQMKPVAVRSRKGIDQTQPMSISRKIVDLVMHDRVAVVSSDATIDPRFKASDSVIAQGVRSAMCVPLLYKEKLIGLIHVDTFSQRNAFTEEDLKLLSGIANQSAIALENAQLYSRTQQQIKELSALLEVSRAISANLNTDIVLQMIMRYSLHLLRAETGSIMLLDESTGELSIKAAVGLNEEIVTTERRKLGEGIAGYVAASATPVLLRNGLQDSQFRNIKKRESVKDALCVPLTYQGKVLGVISVNNRIGEQTFQDKDLELLSTFAAQAAIAIHNAQLYSYLREIYVSTIKAFAAAIEARDPYTRGHSERIARFAVAIAQELQLDSEQLDIIRDASLLHDIGKIGVRESILQKPTSLNDEEYLEMQRHAVLGMQILQSIPTLKPLLSIIHHHQEKFDGTGYPDKLAGESIPLGARIIAVADAYEAMISDRPYRPARTMKQAIKELKKYSGTQFDPKIVSTFIQILERNTL
ncbi:MAG: GAF domain-containing protein [bacterium]|nr:GAF domain-containing protein [bacterium]